MSSDTSARSVWWGSFTIPVGQAGRFRIGPLAIKVIRLANEWQVRREHPEDGNERIVSTEVPAPPSRAPATLDSMLLRPTKDAPEPNRDARETTITRYVTASDTPKLRILPVLPDRTVVTRPENPLTILPETRVTLYVGSPVWVRLLQGEDEMLGDLPVSPPKEAWLGPNTREGELCYATRTYGRLVLDEASLAPHRVMTAVSIENKSEQPFVCERVNLPVRRLSVYASEGGRLWTEPVTMERSGELARIVVGDSPPPVAPGAVRVTGPRDIEDGGMFRAFGTLFR
ncbi:MAG TPA: hypothetical protein VH062_25515 [Polyangiaceae bacterium]|nr:hypothetical protein [Polyangiaceae bacterium]